MNREITAPKSDEDRYQYNAVNIKGLRKKNIPYVIFWIMYYAWIIAFASWWTASPLTDNVFSSHIRELMHTVNILSSSLFLFLVKKEKNLNVMRMSAAVIIVGMVIFLSARDNNIRITAAIISSVAIGYINAGMLIRFIFRLNNTEKMYALVGGNLLIQLISAYLDADKGNNEILLSLAVLALSFCPLIFINENEKFHEEETVNHNPPRMQNRIYLTVFFNCSIIILCKGAGKGILNIAAMNSQKPVLIWYYIGGIAGCLIFYLAYAFSSKAFLWVGNVTFSSVAIGLFCNAFSSEIPVLAVYFAIFLGIGNTVGMINLYYIIGVVGKKYDNLRYIKMSVLLIGVCGGLFGIAAGTLISRIGTTEISISASLISFIVMVLFMMISPVISQTHYGNDWAKDSQNSDIDNEQLRIFINYGLNRRETEVCKLLLEGYTMRQISGILSIAYPTVNTYCTSIYRKTRINSRIELLQVFRDYIKQ